MLSLYQQKLRNLIQAILGINTESGTFYGEMLNDVDRELITHCDCRALHTLSH